MLVAWKRNWRSAAAAAALSGFVWGGLTAPAEAKMTVISQSDKCGTHTYNEERAKGIPRHLLRSISLAESGRYDPSSGVRFAWPWTVMAEGKGRYFQTKQEAVEEVERLQARGVTNIDVGCMQINLHYHPHAFGSLIEAFDPQANVAYASKFLSELKKQTGTWVEAAAHYHSSEPIRGQAYRKRVLALWETIRGGKTAGGLHEMVEDVDPDDKARQAVLQQRALKMRFRARLAAERGLRGRDKHEKQLDAWRIARSNPQLLDHQAAKRRAERQRRLETSTGRNADDFAAKRRKQLAAWRKRNGHTDVADAAGTEDQAETAVPTVSTKAGKLTGTNVNKLIGEAANKIPGYQPPKAPDLGLLE